MEEFGYNIYDAKTLQTLLTTPSILGNTGPFLSLGDDTDNFIRNDIITSQPRPQSVLPTQSSVGIRLPVLTTPSSNAADQINVIQQQIGALQDQLTKLQQSLKNIIATTEPNIQQSSFGIFNTSLNQINIDKSLANKFPSVVEGQMMAHMTLPNTAVSNTQAPPFVRQKLNKVSNVKRASTLFAGPNTQFQLQPNALPTTKKYRIVNSLATTKKYQILNSLPITKKYHIVNSAENDEESSVFIPPGSQSHMIPNQSFEDFHMRNFR